MSEITDMLDFVVSFFKLQMYTEKKVESWFQEYLSPALGPVTPKLKLHSKLREQ